VNTPMDMADRHSAKAINRAIGEELRRLREAAGLSRADFVKQLPSGIGLDHRRSLVFH